VPSLSVGQEGSVELVQGVVKLVLLFESGELVSFVVLNPTTEGRKKPEFTKRSMEICTLRT